MTENELLKFISRIIACGEPNSISHALKELKSILEREGADPKLLKLLSDLSAANREAAELGKSKKGADVNSGEIGKAIRDGRERIQREAFRC